ncbi:MAG TPA: hypothetical protein VL122_04070 [Nitrospirota bacterium]|nr:hypothetical protein [Nitrospirota bacterium]
MNNSIIIRIESGVVAEIFSTSPVQVTVVDYDMIEGGETYEHCEKKAVLSMVPDQFVSQEHIEELVKSLVLECRRPADLVTMMPIKKEKHLP